MRFCVISQNFNKCRLIQWFKNVAWWKAQKNDLIIFLEKFDERYLECP